MDHATTPQPAVPVNAGISLNLHIGQHVRHSDYDGKRVTGTIWGLSFDSDGRLCADVVLDAPIIIPALGDFPECRLHRQYVPVIELSAFDDRDEVIADLLEALREAEAGLEFAGADTLKPSGDFVPAPLLALRAVRAAIGKATGSAP